MVAEPRMARVHSRTSRQTGATSASGLVAAAHSPLPAVGAGRAGAPRDGIGAPAVDEVDHVGEGQARGIAGDEVPAAFATLALDEAALPQVVHDLLEELGRHAGERDDVARGTGAGPSASASRTRALIAYSLLVDRWIT